MRRCMLPRVTSPAPRLGTLCLLFAAAGFVQCKESATSSGGDGPTPPAAAITGASRPPTPQRLDVCAIVSAEDMARSFGYPITAAESDNDGRQCNYLSGHQIEFLIWVVILHGSHVSGKQDAKAWIDSTRNYNGSDRHVFGGIHALPGLGDEAFWFACDFELAGAKGKSAVPTQLEVHVRKGDSVVTASRSLLDPKGRTSVAPEEAAQAIARVMPKLLAAL
jgi:hypothetical protein